MEVKEYEELVGELELRVDRLRSLYDQYFMGIEKTTPNVQHKDVERRIAMLRREQVRNTALRFRFQMLLQRYNTYQTYWQRICRQIEEGTYKRHVQKAKAKIQQREEQMRKDSGSFEVDVSDLELEIEFARVEQAEALQQQQIAGKFGDEEEPFEDTRFEADPASVPPLRAATSPPPVFSAPIAPPPKPVVPPVAGRPAMVWKKVDPNAPKPGPAPVPAPKPAAAAPAPAATARPAAPPPPRSDPRVEPAKPQRPPLARSDVISDTRMRELYTKYVEAKRARRESTAGITYESLAQSLRESGQKLREKHGKSVDFEVVEKDGKTILKPVLK